MKQNNKFTVRTKIFLSFMIFGAVMLLLLWIFQVQFLDQFYRTIKTNSVKNAAQSINTALIEDGDKESIDEIARKNELCVLILNDEFKEIYTSNRRDPRCMIDKMKQSEIGSLYENAIENGGSASQFITTDENHNPNGGPVGKPDTLEMVQKDNAIQNMTYASVLQTDEDQSIIVLVNAEISPVNATVETIRSQLIIITVILFLLAMILASLISKKIARPIMTVNDSAKQLAKGNYDVAFSASGYREIKELNDTLNYAAKELGKVQNLQRELIANMSHDLRTPLTMISGYGEMMRDIPGENTAENVQIIIDEANRLTGLVNDILDLSKLQAGVQTLQISECPITQIIANLVERYQKMVGIQDYHILFEYTEECMIEADEIKINQIIYNLVNNAITYCGDDHTVLIRQKKLNNAVRIEIIDHGAGIAEADLPYVWERYYKTKQHHIRSTVGSGLGLSIVKNILELHHAAYGVQSEIDKGTTFWMEFHDKLQENMK